MTTSSARDDRLTAAQLRQFFLFEALEPEKLDWLAERGRVEHHPAGSTVYAAGDPATCFFVLIQGTLTMSRPAGDYEVETNRSSQPGVYCGATRAWLTPTASQAQAEKYAGTVRALTACDFFQLPADEFGAALQRWFPMAMHLLEGM